MNISYTTAEFRIKLPGVIWEDSPIYKTIHIETTNGRGIASRRKHAQEYFDLQAQVIAKKTKTQVRWNWKGGDGGHYTGGAA